MQRQRVNFCEACLLVLYFGSNLNYNYKTNKLISKKRGTHNKTKYNWKKRERTKGWEGGGKEGREDERKDERMGGRGEEGRKRGRKEGRKDGREGGGRKKERTKGRTKGWEGGGKEGRKRGRKEGRNQGRKRKKASQNTQEVKRDFLNAGSHDCFGFLAEKKTKKKENYDRNNT